MRYVTQSCLRQWLEIRAQTYPWGKNYHRVLDLGPRTRLDWKKILPSHDTDHWTAQPYHRLLSPRAPYEIQARWKNSVVYDVSQLITCTFRNRFTFVWYRNLFRSSKTSIAHALGRWFACIFRISYWPSCHRGKEMTWMTYDLPCDPLFTFLEFINLLLPLERGELPGARYFLCNHRDLIETSLTFCYGSSFPLHSAILVPNSLKIKALKLVTLWNIFINLSELIYF
jgi:hypothetical protein